MSTKCRKTFLGKVRLGGHGGSVAIEFAMLLPLFLFISMGIIEFSVLLYDKAMITNASREGARTGSLFDSTANVSDVVNSYLQDNLISLGGGGSTANVTEQDLTLSGEKQIKVTVTYQYHFLVLPDLSSFFGGGITGPIQLVADTVMRKEKQSE